MEYLKQVFNFMSEINWTLSLIAAIPLAIAANLLTPKVANKLAQHSRKKAEKRIKELEAELHEVLDFATNADKLKHMNWIALFRILLAMALAGLVGSLGVLFFPITATIYFIAFILVQKQLALIRRCSEFQKYENKTTEEIKKLYEKIDT
jgi:multidrug efflux pump subunit AcrB